MDGLLPGARRIALCLTGSLSLFSAPAALWAEDGVDSVEVRHGAVSGWRDAEVEAGLTIVAQGTSDGDADAELTTSFDLVATLPTGPGKLVIYVEGNTSPSRNGVAALFAEANADAGTALDRDGDGRLQVSELHYIQALNSHGIAVVGLLDPTTSLDTSHIANDETGQFLTTSLVNNPSIGFPDYTLGAIYNHDLDGNVTMTLMLTGSNGLGDNPDASYAQLVDVTEDGKGVFAAAELQWLPGAYALRGGAWLNTATG